MIGAPLAKTIDAGPSAPLPATLATNLAVLLAFLVPHSVMARPRFKAWWTHIVPRELERTTYVLFSGLGTLLMIGDDIRKSQWLAARVAAHDELELFTQNLSITTFRYVPRDVAALPATREDVERHLDQLNRELVDRIQRSGEAFVSNAVVRGRYVLRPCIVNFRTSQADLAALIDTVVRLGRQIDASLRRAQG